MEKPRQPRDNGAYQSDKSAYHYSRQSFRKRRWWFLSGIGSNELLIGALLIPLIAAARFISDTSFEMHDLLKFIGVGAVLLALAWGLHTLGKLAWRLASTPRMGVSSKTSHSGPWRYRPVPQMGNFLPFQRRIVSWFMIELRQGRLPSAKLIGMALIGGAIAGAAISKFVPSFEAKPNTASASVPFHLCESVLKQNCVVDGDTIYYGGVKIRLADIDTPEISSPKCTSELELGQRAKHRLLELVNAGSFEVTYKGGRDEDVYGRKLRIIKRNGQSVGDTLIKEGLARRWDGARRSWCG